ncbi:IclR family transcriptional regulator [Leucobacter sp. CSA1]|uniref:IclR family transcriptional regulator n=1 Tax=Leucobacter chromiisoli TaxID=2796471 RepID=A0A934Q9K0_9MICO|nr:IclR family transcriptional regulator [Leucobacter chromiisoli]MBK0419785.1 IclR family transcriptional regulator [Leucobacter chromiisoli]
MAENQKSSGTESATRVTSLLLLFISGKRAWGVSEISRELGLSKAVVHRMLQALTAQSFLTQNRGTREYTLGPAAAAFGAAGMRSSDLRRVARPVLERLHAATNETVTLSSLVGEQRVYLDQIESLREIKMAVELGRLFPLNAGSSGRVILAYLSEDRREHLLHTVLPRITSHTILDADALRADCERIREVGYAVSQGERQVGAGSVAAPIFDLDDEVVGSISICGPIDRLSVEVLESMSGVLLEHAHEISTELGYHPDDSSHAHPPAGRLP